MKLTLEQFKNYIHSFDDNTVEEDIASSFSWNDQICDMTNEDAPLEYKIDFDSISYFTFDSDFFAFKNKEKIPKTTYMIFVKLGEFENSVFGITYMISEELEKEILNGKQYLGQKIF